MVDPSAVIEGGARRLALAVLVAGFVGCARAPTAHPRPQRVDVAPPERVALVTAFGGERFMRPLDARQAPGDEARWYIAEQRGTIVEVTQDGDRWRRRDVLDLRDVIARRHNEEGLLGLAFDPGFATSGGAREGAFYVNYSVEPGPLSRLSRFRFDPGGGVPRSSEEVLLEVPQPWRNHNGGGLAFGPDGYLYYSLGDGGAFGDPHGHSQNLGTLLGAILRLDVSGADGERPYRIPPDNPLVGRVATRPELWAWGLRNVWRFAFDRETGEMWGGDVGQDEFEFVHVIQPGGNHGWDLLEGFVRYELGEEDEVPDGLVPPVHDYAHDVGLSITGGFVYRGNRLPELQGWYVFGDYVMKQVWAIRRRDDGAVLHTTLLEGGPLIASFAESHDGELLVVGHDGFLRWLAPAADAEP